MKTICDWNNCKNIGEYKAPIERDIVKNIDYFVWNILKNLIKTGIILKI